MIYLFLTSPVHEHIEPLGLIDMNGCIYDLC